MGNGVSQPNQRGPRNACVRTSAHGSERRSVTGRYRIDPTGRRLSFRDAGGVAVAASRWQAVGQGKIHINTDSDGAKGSISDLIDDAEEYDDPYKQAYLSRPRKRTDILYDETNTKTYHTYGGCSAKQDRKNYNKTKGTSSAVTKFYEL